VRRLDPGDPSDLEILQALSGHPAGPVPGDALAAALGVSPERARVRIGSLVSLGYVADQSGGYLLAERGWAGLRRGPVRRLPARRARVGGAAPPPPAGGGVTAWRWLLRPVCRLLGHRMATMRIVRGPVLRCPRCGAILAAPQR
jgi:hypothetical protein